MSKGEFLIAIEDNRISFYPLGQKKIWSVGRPSKDIVPDIKLNSAAVSRRHGKFQNMDGYWFYIDGKSKNGTFHNDRRISTGIGGRTKPVILEDGDIFLFGCGQTPVINNKTAWAVYLAAGYDDIENCRIEDTSSFEDICLTDGKNITKLSNLKEGTVIKQSDGMAIYMGNITYLIGKMKIGK